MTIGRPFGAAVALVIVLIVFSSAMAGSLPPLSAYGALPKTEAFELSPNGEMFALIKTEGDDRFLVVQAIGGQMVMVGRVGDLKVADMTWADDDHVIVYTHRTEKFGNGGTINAEFIQAVVANVKTRKFSALVDRNRTGYLPAVFGHYGFLQEAGETSALVELNGPELVKIGLDSGKSQHIAFGNWNNRDWALDDKGQVAAISEYENKSGNWKVMLSDSTTPIASGHAAFGFGLGGLGRSLGSVIIEEYDTDGDRLEELRLSDGSRSDLAPEDTVSRLIYARPTHLLTGMVMESERTKTVLFDPILARHMAGIEKAFEGASVTFNSITTDQSKVVVYVEGTGTTGTYQLVDFNTKRATPLADAYPGIPETAVGTIEVVDYKASDGLAIEGILTLPYGSARSNLPLVVIPHGGPEAMDSVHFDWFAQAFASRGYAVFQPNFRGSTGHGAAFRKAGFGQWGRKMQTDISEGVAALAAQGVIDPKRVCIVGASYGGYAALAGVTLQHGLYRCAASYAGISEPPVHIPDGKNGATRHWRSYMGLGENDFRVPDEISPLAHAAQADAPILLIHGKDDSVVSFWQSDKMAWELKRAGKPVEFMTLKGEDHWLSRSPTRLQMLEAMMAFVQKYNPSGAPSN